MSNERANLRVWLYRRTAAAAFVPIPIKTWDQWVYGSAALPPSDDEFVWYVTLTVWTLNRKVVGVHGVQFSKSRVNAAGFHDEEMKLDEMAVALNSAWPVERTDPSGPVVDAANRFAQRRFRWKPSAADLRALHDIVNRRARRPLQLR